MSDPVANPAVIATSTPITVVPTADAAADTTVTIATSPASDSPPSTGPAGPNSSFFTFQKMGSHSDDVLFHLDAAVSPVSAGNSLTPALLATFDQVPMPNINWRGPISTENYDSGRLGHQPVAICDHIMEGGFDGNDSWFKDPNGLSSHYAVAQDGRIYQYVKDEDTAYTNGLGYDAQGHPEDRNPTIPESPDTSVSWLNKAVQSQINPNRLTLTIEHEGFYTKSKGALTDAQYQATLALHRYLVRKYNIPPTRDHIIGHYQISPTNKPHCPGDLFPFDQLVADLAQTTPVVLVGYDVSILSVATVREGPGRNYNKVADKQPSTNQTFHVKAEAHGEAIFDNGRNRWDNVWLYIPDLDGISGFVNAHGG